MSCPIADDMNVSASEASKGGIKYEVTIADPKVTTPPRVSSPCLKQSVSVEFIQQKLDAAAERRQSLEAEKLASLAEKRRRIEEATRKKELEESQFKEATKETLEKKLESHVENRENIISDLKTKLSSHNTDHLKSVRQNLEAALTEQQKEVEKEILTKLELAEKNREKIIQERLENLKKHDEKVEMIRNKMNTSVDLQADNETASSG